MKSLECVLEDAISSGEVVSVKYMAGSQPGVVRDISPISIDGDNVRARCLVSNSAKVFKISKMFLSDGVADYKQESDIEPLSLADGLSKYENELVDLGWVLKVDDEGAGVYRCFKNGKLRKTPDISIQYHKHRVELDFESGLMVEVGLSDRPWYVTRYKSNASSFKILSKAILKFMNNTKEAGVALGMHL